MKYSVKVVTLLLCILMVLSSLFIGCSNIKRDKAKESEPVVEEERIVIGFAQVGAESDWRSANTESMKSTFTTENGYELIFEDGQQKQTNQITAIRSFIQQEVDYIVLAPVTETGWDTVLQEAKDAGIPVIIVDRMVDVEDDSLFTCWVGSNFELEGRKACEWLHEYCDLNNINASDIHIADIQGTLGNSAQIGRTNGLLATSEQYGWDVVAMADGDFTQSKGREAMDGLLREYNNINVVYCENDNSAMGAIEALEAAGKTVGSDIKNGEIMVISFDGVNEEALSYVLEDKITLIAERNPLHGPRVQTIIDELEAGDVPEKYTYVDEGMISAYPDITKLSLDGGLYEVIIMK